MKEMTLHRTCRSLRCELCAWQPSGGKAAPGLSRPLDGPRRAVLGLLVLSTLWNGLQTARIHRLEAARRETAAQLAQAEEARDCALDKLVDVSRETERERQARLAQAAAYEAVGDYRYIGECTITAYCPCAECCGRWADGLTATGLPAEPGIVAVDPAVIPLGSTVIIDGQRYLAADTGVTGYCVDICLAAHQETVEHGVRAAEVWVADSGGKHG